MVQVRPLVAREFAETAHDRMLGESEQVVAQSGRGGQVESGEELQGGTGPKGVAGVGGFAGAAADA